MLSASRRSFLQMGTTGVAAAVTVASARSSSAGTIDRLRLALVGCGGRGSGTVGSFAELHNVEVVYVCDPDIGRAGTAASKLGGKPQAIKDLRIALDDKNVDAVIIATPDHWHAPASILALDAGKHVYVEKPCSHNLREGRLLVEAAQRNRRVVQHGTQHRSNSLVVHGVKLLRSGLIGDVLVAKAWNVQRRAQIGHAEPSDPPPGLDYDLWVGPAPWVPFQKNRHHYNWHWWFNFGTGDTGNDGVHELDIARWGLGVDVHPARVAALGGKLHFDDDQQFPDTQYVTFDYPGDGQTGIQRQLVFEMRLWSRYGLEGVDNGNAFYGTKGWMLLSKRGILRAFDERNKEMPIPDVEPVVSNHFQNFADAIRNGTELRADIPTGHRSAALCHLANISTRLGRTLELDPQGERIVGDEQANTLLARTYRERHWAVPDNV